MCLSRMLGLRFAALLAVAFVVGLGCDPPKGGNSNPDTKTCTLCGGSGVSGSYQPAAGNPGQSGGGGQFVTHVCPACGGTGKGR